MPRFEYMVIPAPKRAAKVKGVKTTEDRFAHTLMELMNEHGKEGWEYQRTDTMPVETRTGLGKKSLEDQSVLVFRRVLAEEPLILGTPLGNAKSHNAPSLPGVGADVPSKAPQVTSPRTGPAD